MSRLVSLLAVCAALASTSIAAPPAEEKVQGLYEGIYKDDKGQQKTEARLVACGKDTYKLFLRRALADGKVAKIDLESKIDADSVRFKGKADGVEWTVTAADGAIRGAGVPSGTLELKRIARPSPTLGAKPPEGAVVLLDANKYDEMTKQPRKDKTEQEWKVSDDGGVLIPKGGMNAKRRFEGSFKMHVEFKIPLMPQGRGQGRGNSGVYLPNGDEIQVLDSFGMTTYKGGGCGGLYAYKDPDTFDEFSLASAPPLEWQAFDIEYRAERKDGKLAGKPRVTVLHNGIKIHDNALLEREARPGGFHFQDHGCPVEYRNIWVQPLAEK